MFFCKFPKILVKNALSADFCFPRGGGAAQIRSLKYNGSVIIKQPEKFFGKTYVVCICATFCSMLWGSAFPCVKAGYALFGIDPSHVPSLLLFAGARFTLAGALVIVAGSIARKKFLLPGRKNLGLTAAVCLFQTCLQYTFFYIGVANSTGVKSSVLNGLGVFFTILAACFIYRTEKFNAVKLAGCLLGFCGVIIINLGGDGGGGFSLTGEGFVIFSCMCSALAAGLMKVVAGRGDTVATCGWQFFCGGAVLAAAGAAGGGQIPAAGGGAVCMLLYLAFLSACAFTLQGILLKYNPVSRVAVFKSANPVFGAVFSALILGESRQLLSPYTLVALLFVCAGIFLINKFGGGRRKNEK